MEELPPASYFHGKTLLGLDYGTVVLGTALFRVGEDPFPLLADPIDRKNDRQALEAILSLAALEGIHHIVLGLPLHLDGTPSPMSRRVGRFGQKDQGGGPGPPPGHLLPGRGPHLPRGPIPHEPLSQVQLQGLTQRHPRRGRQYGPGRVLGPGGEGRAMKKALLFLVLAPLLGLGGAAGLVYYHVYLWRYPGPERIVEVSPGQGPAHISERLQREGLIGSARVFRRFVQFKGLGGQFKVGRYRARPGLTMEALIDLLVSGASVTLRATIPEGKNLYQVAHILEEAGIIDDGAHFISLCQDPSFLAKLSLEGPSCEGRLYPDTYYFAANTPEDRAIAKLYAVFREKTRHLDFSRTSLSPLEVITLASIVEKETGASWERPRIAGVFHNRLKRRMRLQSDPTTIYGIWDRYRGNLKRSDLREWTPYNTYRIPRLPPGPISNPGLASIQAVLGPEEHGYLYFVSQNDGTHVFSKNYRDHHRAVGKYQKRRAARRGKSWRDLKGP